MTAGNAVAVRCPYFLRARGGRLLSEHLWGVQRGQGHPGNSAGRTSTGTGRTAIVASLAVGRSQEAVLAGV